MMQGQGLALGDECIEWHVHRFLTYTYHTQNARSEISSLGFFKVEHLEYTCKTI